METGFKSLNRRQLQDLCKKHQLPARTTNSQMAESLAILQLEIIQSQEKNKPRGCLKGSGGSSGAPKKVTFSVEVEVRNIVRTPKMGAGYRRKVRRRTTRSRAIRCRTEGVSVELNHNVNFSSEEADGVCTTRSLRNRVVVIVGCNGGGRRNKTGSAEGVEDVESLDRGLHCKGEGDHAAEKKTSSQVPSVRCLRSRSVAVGGVSTTGDIEQGRTRKRRRFAITAEDTEVSLNGNSAETEVIEKNDLHDQLEGKVSAVEVVSKEGSLKVPLRRSRRTLLNPGPDEVGVEEASLAGIATARGDDGAANGRNKSSQKLGDNVALKPDRASLTETSTSPFLKGSEIRELPRRSSCSSRLNALRHEFSVDDKIAEKNGSVREVIGNSGPKYEAATEHSEAHKKTNSQLEGSSKMLTRSSARRSRYPC